MGRHCWLAQQCEVRDDSNFRHATFGSLLSRVLLSTILFLFTTAPAQAQYSPDERFLSALRASRLYDLADDVCRNRLSASKLTPRERVILTVERMLVLTEKGVNAPLADRPAAFAAARKIAADFATNFADEPRGVLVRFQDALTVLTLGELQRLEAELGTSSPADLETAKNTLRDAVKQLEAFDADLQKRIPDARAAAAAKQGVTAEELTALRTHVGFQLARAARNQALLYPEKGEDRTASLLRGKRQLDEAVLALGEDEPLYWQASIEAATFARMLGEPGRADILLEEVAAKNPPPYAIPLLHAEAVRVLLALDKAADAAAQGAKWAESITPRDADLDLAVLEALVADAKKTSSTELLTERLTEIENRHGPYWGRRASALVLKRAPAGMASESLELLARTADQLFLQKNYDAAIASYDRAAQKAHEAGKADLFVEQSMKAALVEQERKAYSEAARRFLEIAAQPEAQSKAAETHLAAAWNQLQLVRAMPTDAKIFVRFEEIAKDHIAKFKDSSTASTAKLWLAREYESRREFQNAFEFAKWIPTTAKESEEALLLCLRKFNRESGSFDNRKRDLLTPALTWAKTAEGDLSTPTQRKIRAAAIGWELLNDPDAKHAQAEAKLQELIEKTPDSEPETVASAKTLLVVALAAQPAKFEEAGKMLEKSGGTAKQRLTALLGLVKVMKNAGRDVREPLGTFVLGVIEKIKPHLNELSDTDKLMVDLAFADALFAKGDPQTEGAFSAVAKKHSNSAIIQEAFADYLSQASNLGPGYPSRGAALDQWRLVASRSEPKSDRWYRAKYHVALIQFQMGQKAEAAKLIDYLDALPPGLKGAPLEAEFRALRKQCGEGPATR